MGVRKWILSKVPDPTQLLKTMELIHLKGVWAGWLAESEIATCRYQLLMILNMLLVLGCMQKFTLYHSLAFFSFF